MHSFKIVQCVCDIDKYILRARPCTESHCVSWVDQRCKFRSIVIKGCEYKVTISYSVDILNVKIESGMYINYTIIMNDYKYFFIPCLKVWGDYRNIPLSWQLILYAPWVILKCFKKLIFHVPMPYSSIWQYIAIYFCGDSTRPAVTFHGLDRSNYPTDCSIDTE